MYIIERASFLRIWLELFRVYPAQAEYVKAYNKNVIEKNLRAERNVLKSKRGHQSYLLYTSEHTMIQIWRITAEQTKQIELPQDTDLNVITRQLPDGFYSTFRTYGQGTRVIGLKAHLQRLYGPVRSPQVSELTLRKQLGLLLKDYSNEARVRLIMTKQGELYVAIEALKQWPNEIYEKGVKVETVELTRTDPRLKSTRFIGESESERKHIVQKGIFEALIVKNGKILEGLTSNFFYVLRPACPVPSGPGRGTWDAGTGERSEAQSKDGIQEKSSPPRSSRFDYGIEEHNPSAPQENAGTSQREVLCTAQRDILLGVTRRTVIHLARGIGLEIVYEPLKRDQTQVAQEAFITSSSRGIVPVIQIDGEMVGEGSVGAITRQLSVAYEAYVLEKAERI